MDLFFQDAEYENNPIWAIKEFLDQERAQETSGQYERMRFVGYVLDISYEEVNIITSDPYKLAVGGIPRGSFLIMVPNTFTRMPPHFTLLRVSSTAPTPLSRDVQQTYFELHKKSMPELDRWTNSELQWGALTTHVLGMYYPHPTKQEEIAFSGDVNNVVSGHKYKVYSPTEELLKLIINGTLTKENRFSIGKLRVTECQLPFHNKVQPDVDVNVSTNDFRGFRTAMFGKTRLGKSNVVKLIAQSVIETNKKGLNVGQLIFDINGEYANDNPQNTSIKSAYPDDCEVYALTKRSQTDSKPLRLNFYEQPDSCMSVIADFIRNSPIGQSGYLQSFASVAIPSITEVNAMPHSERTRAYRKILYYWAILKDAGFEANEGRLRNLINGGRNRRPFNPGFSQAFRDEAYTLAEIEAADVPTSLDSLQQLVNELKILDDFRRENPRSPHLTSSSGNPQFDKDDIAMLEFLNPTGGRTTGTSIIRPLRDYHSSDAGNFLEEIKAHIDDKKTVILDLGNATDSIRQYFSDMVSKDIFQHQERKFTNNKLGDHFVQIYFEEAHNLFPRNNDVTDVYSRFAKEGAKFHIGIVYSTQSPSTVNRDLLAQTENFFVGHLSSKDEAAALAKLQIAFTGVQQDIMSSRTPGYMRMLTFSHRFVVPVQAHLFEAKTQEDAVPAR